MTSKGLIQYSLEQLSLAKASTQCSSGIFFMENSLRQRENNEVYKLRANLDKYFLYTCVLLPWDFKHTTVIPTDTKYIDWYLWVKRYVNIKYLLCIFNKCQLRLSISNWFTDGGSGPTVLVETVTHKDHLPRECENVETQQQFLYEESPIYQNGSW